MTFTNSASSIGSINIVLTAGVGYFLAPGESLNSHPDGPNPPAGSRFEQWYINIDGQQADSGDFSACTGTTTPPTTQPSVPDVAPALISECRGADWYLLNPDIDGEDYTWAYRLGEELGILYDPDYTSNNPDAVYGEVLVPAGTNEVGYVDDFNAQHAATRPAECGGPETPTTTPTEADDSDDRSQRQRGPQHGGRSRQRVRRCRCRDRPRFGNVWCHRLRCG